MLLQEYMEKYNRKALNGIEVTAFGIPDMRKGWPKRYAKLEVTDEMLKLIIKSPASTKSTRKVQKKIFNSVVSAKKYEVTDEKLLYLMQNENGLLKIGISKDPVQRARTLTTGSGVKVFVLCAWKLDKNARMVENSLHKAFGISRLEGEWFKPGSFTPEMVEEKISCNYTRLQEPYFVSAVDMIMEYQELVYDHIVRETDKAILFAMRDGSLWLPKSQIFHHNADFKYIKVPSEFMKTKLSI